MDYFEDEEEFELQEFEDGDFVEDNNSEIDLDNNVEPNVVKLRKSLFLSKPNLVISKLGNGSKRQQKMLIRTFKRCHGKEVGTRDYTNTSFSYPETSKQNMIKRLYIRKVNEENKEPDFKNNKKTLKKTVLSYKRLESLELNEIISLSIIKALKYIRKLQNLSINLSFDDLTKLFGKIKRLPCIKELSLSIKGTETNEESLSDQQFPLEPLLRLFKLNTLKTFNLTYYIHSRKDALLFEALLSGINQYKIPEFKIQAHLNQNFRLELKQANEFLKIINLLVINQTPKLDNKPVSNPSKPKLTSVMKGNQKVVELHFSEQIKLDLGNIIKNCISLQNLYLKLGSPRPLVCKSLPFSRNLMNIVLEISCKADEDISLVIQGFMHMIKVHDSLESFTCFLPMFGSLTANKLSQMHKLPCFENLPNYSLDVFAKTRESYFEVFSSPVLHSYFKDFSSMKSIKNLELKFKYLFTPHRVERWLNAIPNFPDEDKIKSVFYFPFDSVKEIRSLKLEMDADLPEDFWKHFMGNLACLENLVKFEIPSQIKNDSDTSQAFDAISNLLKLRSLKVKDLTGTRQITI